MVRDTAANSNNSFSFKPSSRQLLMVLITATIAVGGVTTYRQFKTAENNAAKEAEVRIPEITVITALGSLEPKGEIVKVSAPTSSQENRVEQLLVKEGDKVESGQIIAVLDNKDRLQSDVVKAEQQVKIAQANLAKVRAGAKSGDIAAQKATIARLEAQLEGDRASQADAVIRLKAQLEGDIAAQQATIERIEAEVRNAQAEYQRYEKLYKDGAISRSVFDSKRLGMETTQKQLSEAKAILTRIEATGTKQISEAETALKRINSTGSKQISEAEATLNSVSEVRSVDVQAASAEVNDAVAAVNQAKEKLKQVYVRSPQAGEVLEIHTRGGEVVSNNGIVEIGQTSQMYANAEVYQTDISKVKIGQKATITSNSLPSELQGTVDWIGSKIRRQSVINTDPSENIDAKVVEVRIRLDNKSKEIASKFTNLQVEVRIEQ
ncbi:ABC exporter membrane fusion protein [Plectonema cf. radiosum LEGE 06105]|uniref:ABC exporter membrane fusion protein n=1 Tax=Plectonema cf. radiosum LEGE 06105 TaxID=945769 RepID=A0A8J7FE89_9CYAN|nr:ABC exporter membrane fusion protein [Plectonema radiosum]MBE9217084.1 ABC exporter membrane fusion protein [Plectonema cf. radiosum LEGE 06105]